MLSINCCFALKYLQVNANTIPDPNHSGNCAISLNFTTFAFVSCGNQDGNSVIWPVIIFCVVVGIMIGCCVRLRGKFSWTAEYLDVS